MARHDQLGRQSTFVCTHCQAGECEECVDILRSLYTENMICMCSRNEHSGEPVLKQIVDPETGTVYAPGLSVTKEGEVNDL